MSSKIETLNGHFVDPLNMDPADVRIEDIAHALSMQCRFSGYVSRPYSVAEHSVYVARLTAMTLAQRWGFQHWRDVLANPKHKTTVRQALLHDATEAYLVDLPSPLKRHFPEFRAAEHKLWAVLAGVFNVPEDMHALVKEVDGRICTTEKLALLGPAMTEEEWGAFFRTFPPYEGVWDIIDRYEVGWRQARRRFIDFYELVREG